MFWNVARPHRRSQPSFGAVAVFEGQSKLDSETFHGPHPRLPPVVAELGAPLEHPGQLARSKGSGHGCSQTYLANGQSQAR